MHNASTRTLLTLAIAALLTACAQPQTPPPAPVAAPAFKSGEQMLMESQRLQQLGQRWSDGQKMVQQGEEIVREGEAKIEEGRGMIKEGQRIMRESQEGTAGAK